MKPFDPLDKIDYVQDTIVNDTITESGDSSVVLMALDSGTEISTHTSSTKDCIFILEGDIEFIVKTDKFNLSTGEMLIIEKDTPHSVTALSQVKLLLTKLS